jgi:hypothetical protein
MIESMVLHCVISGFRACINMVGEMVHSGRITKWESKNNGKNCDVPYHLYMGGAFALLYA